MRTISLLSRWIGKKSLIVRWQVEVISSDSRNSQYLRYLFILTHYPVNRGGLGTTVC